MLDEAKAAEMATNLVADTRPPHGGTTARRPAARRRPTRRNPRAQANLSDLASRLGLDPQALLEQPKSGGTLGSSASRRSAGASVDGGLVVDAYA